MAIRYLDEPTTAQPQAAQPAGRIRYLDEETDSDPMDFSQLTQPVEPTVLPSEQPKPAPRKKVGGFLPIESRGLEEPKFFEEIEEFGPDVEQFLATLPTASKEQLATIRAEIGKMPEGDRAALQDAVYMRHGPSAFGIAGNTTSKELVQRADQSKEINLAPGASGAFGRAVIGSTGPTTGAITGAATFSRVPGPPIVKIPATILGVFTGAYAGLKGQELAENKLLGEERAATLARQRMADIEAQPGATFAGEVLPSMAFLRPNASGLKAAGDLARKLTGAQGKEAVTQTWRAASPEARAYLINSAFGSGVDTTLQTIREAMREDGIDLAGVGRILAAAGIGASQVDPTRLGRRLGLQNTIDLPAQRLPDVTPPRTTVPDATPTRFDEDPRATAVLREALAQPEPRLADIVPEETALAGLRDVAPEQVRTPIDDALAAPRTTAQAAPKAADVAIPEGVVDMPQEKAQAIASAANDPEVTLVYSHSNIKADIPNAPEFSQVDAFKNGENLFSSNPSDLRAFGYDVPDLPPNTAQGKYSLEQAKAMSAPKAPAPTESAAAPRAAEAAAPAPEAAPAPKAAPKGDYTVKEWLADLDAGKNLEDLPNPSIRGMEQLRARDKRLKDISGRINITPGTTTLGGALVGGAGGAGYGITQGDTPEERIENAIKYGVAWAGIGAGAGLGSGKLAQARRLTHSQKVIRAAQELERMRTGAGSVAVPHRGASGKALKQIQDKALGTDGMPNWWIKMRSTPVMQAIREGIRNRSSRAKDVLVSTVKAGDTVADEENFYVAQRLFPGRARAQKQATDTLFKESEKAFKDAAKKAGIDPTVTAEQYADYMRAKHAPAYNKYVGEPGDASPASGMTDAQAAAKIQAYKEAGLDKFFEDFAATDRNIVDATRKILEGDIITPEHAAWLRKNAPDYVPLNRDIDLEDAVFNVGGTRGFTVKGSGIRKAVGSELPYADMRGNLQANLTDAIIRVEKNRVAQRVYKFFEKHPWPGVSLERPKVIGTRKIAGGHEIPLYEPVPEGTMVARFGGKPHYVRFRDPKLANAFGDFGMDQISPVFRWIGTLTRLFSGLVTRLNPNFWLPNLIRDRFDAFSQHASMNDWRGAFAQISPVTRGGVAENMRGVMDNFLNIDSADSKLYRQMIDDGGTSGGYGLSSRQDILEHITKMREKLNKGVFGRTDWLKTVDLINELSENSTRLGAYRRSLQVGATREQAALAARDISIDFDMKGTLTKELASLWAFLNPATQGPVNFLKAQVRNPKTAIAILSGIAGVSAALNKINNSIDEEWKQKPQFRHARETGFPILYGRDPVTGDIQYLTIPIAQSMRPFKAMIDLGLDVSSGEIEDVRQGMRDAAMVLFNENPTGASRPGFSQITPTLARPFVDIIENRDYADRPLYPDFFRGKPEIENKARMYASTPDTPIGKAAIQMSAIADAAFDMDVSPEHVQYIVESYLGGPGRTATQTINLVGSLAKGEAPAPRDIPIASSFMREARGETSERNTKEYREAYEAFSKAATQDALVRGRAMGMFNKVRDLPQDQWIPTLIQQLEGGAGDRLADGTVDRNFARSLANIVESEMKGLTATDEVILKMRVGSGARAQYYFDKINKLPPEQRAAYIVEQKRKGLITPDVEKQLIAMFRQQPK